MFSDTVGVCMKTDIPACFSHRERLFIVESMVKDFKEIFTAMEELIGYQLNIDVKGMYYSKRIHAEEYFEKLDIII